MTVYTRTVHTQVELDKALADEVEDIIIDSPRGVWITISGSATVRASGSATISAYDSATVSASDSATVRASGSATVSAYDSATVSAYDSATVRASDSATVSAYDSATVRAYDSATVSAYDSATVSAYDSATVSAYDSATVRAGKYVAVHLHDARVKVQGGVVIDVTDVRRGTPEAWVEYYGLDVADGKATVFKAVDQALNAGQGHIVTAYPIGGTVTASDWKPKAQCGNGLHFAGSPHHTVTYFQGSGAPRFLACEVDLATLVVLDDKVKAEMCRVLYEVDVHGRQLAAAVAAEVA